MVEHHICLDNKGTIPHKSQKWGHFLKKGSKVDLVSDKGMKCPNQF